MRFHEGMTVLSTALMPNTTRVAQSVAWDTGGVTWNFNIRGPVSLDSIEDGSEWLDPISRQPLVEVIIAGQGRARSQMAHRESLVGERLRYTGHAAEQEGGRHFLRIEQADPVTGLSATVQLTAWEGLAAVEARTVVRNGSDRPVRLEAVSSLAFGTAASREELDGAELAQADSVWLAENQWEVRPLSRRLADLGVDCARHGQSCRGRHYLRSGTTWSTGEHLPMGAVTLPRRELGPLTLMWQIEHNGPWLWELSAIEGGFYLGLFGPTDSEHQWHPVLQPGESFTTVPVSLALATGGFDSAAAVLTRHRRRVVAPRLADAPLPVVFNDYMNTIMGDPTAEALGPLIEAAAAVGAEVFCIDAGWYDDNSGWWNSVGTWRASGQRFSGGLGQVTSSIRGLGMIPGLWLEPEAVGIDSPVAAALPDAAFLNRGGERVLEHGRYHLNLTHPAAREHLDQVVDRLVADYGVGYFKLDYNMICPGADGDDGAGAGLLDHARALLDWLDGLAERHPRLLLENCSSGGMRADYAMLARANLQSTSDQQDLLLYPMIAAAAPASILPEQAANWAYPQPTMSPEEAAFTLCTGLAGRLYLSGWISKMSSPQLELVRQAVTLAKAGRDDLRNAVPAWPLGLPGWRDPWLVQALLWPDVTQLVCWRKPGAPSRLEIPLPALAGRNADARVVFPDRCDGIGGWGLRWDGGSGQLTVDCAGSSPQARVIRLDHG
jgi:alpha-galactosidase